MGFDTPSAPPPLPPPPQPTAEVEPDLNELAANRRALERRRRGSQSLIVNPTSSTSGGTGLRI